MGKNVAGGPQFLLKLRYLGYTLKYYTYFFFFIVILKHSKISENEIYIKFSKHYIPQQLEQYLCQLSEILQTSEMD